MKKFLAFLLALALMLSLAACSEISSGNKKKDKDDDDSSNKIGSFFGEQEHGAIAEPEQNVLEGVTAPTNQFDNPDIDGRWVVDAISVIPTKAYWEEGTLYMVAAIFNGYSTEATNISITRISVSNEEEMLAEGSFAEQNLTISSLCYVLHTFSFSEEAVRSAGGDLSTLNLSVDWSATH